MANTFTCNIFISIIYYKYLTHTQHRRLRLTPEQASDFYAEHYGKMFFPSLIAYMQR